MAEIIPFEDIVRTRRRRRERESLERCLEILRLNLELTRILFEETHEPERSVRHRQLLQLAELIEYGERLV